MSISLTTPSYRGDFVRCKILCDSIDRYVTGFECHRLIVNDEDVEFFQGLVGPRRTVEPVKTHLPTWIRPLPFGLRYHGRKMWLSLRTRPIHGWHVQQLVKLGVAAGGTSEFSINLDSDTVFVRPFDCAGWIGDGASSPLLRTPGGITADLAWHPTWLEHATTVLGLPALPLPADDYVGNVIAWRGETVRALLARIEATTGVDWMVALCRARPFSEYLLYGCFVASEPDELRRHTWTDDSLCASHWGTEALDEQSLQELVASLSPAQVALAIQSFSDTPAGLIRDVAGLERD